MCPWETWQLVINVVNNRVIFHQYCVVSKVLNYKVRFFIRGDEKINANVEIFAPIAAMHERKLILRLLGFFGVSAKQISINAAFLHPQRRVPIFLELSLRHVAVKQTNF